MIIGIGTDIIEISRIEEVLNRTPSFMNKVFTEDEIEMFKNKGMRSESIAGNYAVKEAVSKAIGTGLRGFSFKDIEVLRDELGKPLINISEKIKNIINKEVVVHGSISHNRSTVIAFVVIENA